MEKKGRKQTVISLLTVTLFFLLIALVFRDDYLAIAEGILSISPVGVILLFIMGAGYQLLDAAAYFSLLRSAFPEVRFHQGAAVVFLGVFANVATFSAGTIPMQSYYLYRCGMVLGTGVGLAILEYVFHKAAVLLYAVVMAAVYRGWLGEIFAQSKQYLMIGCAVCALIIVFLILICTWNRIFRLALWVIGKLPSTGKWTERKNIWSTNLEALYKEAQQLLHNRSCRRKVLLLNLVKLCWMYSIPFLCIRLLGREEISFWQVQALSAMMMLLVGALPNVAGMGPAEFAFLLVFSPYIGHITASSAMILYRLSTYFLPFLISIIVFFKTQKQMLTRK